MSRLGLAVAALALAGCSGNDGAADPSATATADPQASLTVAATVAGPATATGAATVAATDAEEQPAPPPERGPFAVGAVDDAVRTPGPTLEQLAVAGFGAVGITSYWEPGLSAPSAAERTTLRSVARRAAERRLRVFLSVFQRGSATTPLTPEERAAFAAYVAAIVRDVPTIRDVIVGNEPNLNRFWLPQFGPDGEDLAAAFYFRLLAEVYDRAKAAAPDLLIWGGALAPRGVDKPNTGRDTHSPTTFIRDLGAELHASGRTEPLMDGFAFHPYPPASDIPPDRSHEGSRSLGLADHDRLARLLRNALGRDVPILYSELGVETRIPAAKQHLYEGAEPARPVDEETQADYYRRALELAACQNGVAGILLFHSHDEPFLTGFQSGVYYVDGTPKTSLEPVRSAIRAARAGC